MPEDLDKLKDEFNKHLIADAHFESSTAAYIKNAAEDIGDIKTSIENITHSHLTAIKSLTKGLSDEATERKVDDTKLRGRIDGYAKVVGGIAFFLGVAATILRLVGMI